MIKYVEQTRIFKSDIQPEKTAKPDKVKKGEQTEELNSRRPAQPTQRNSAAPYPILKMGSESLVYADSIQCGDASFLLRSLPVDSIDLIVTSPPYYLQRGYNGAGMGAGHERSVDHYVDSLMDVFNEAVRVIKPTGSIVFNIGDKYQRGSLLLVPFRFALRASESEIVRLVNNITWVKTNPTPRQFNRRLVSSTEPFFHFVKSSEYYYDRDAFMAQERSVPKHKPTGRLGMKYRGLIDASALSDMEKEGAHKALDDVIEQVKSSAIHSFRMKIRGVHAEAFGGQEGGRKIQMEKLGFTIIRIKGKPMKKDVINSTVESIPGLKHDAVFPLSLIRELIRLLCPVGGVVVDPYIGSGTSAVAAKLEGRKYIGIDIDPSYCDLAIRRVRECEKTMC